MPGDGHRGAPAGRERVRAGLRAGARADDAAIRYGLSAVRNVGAGAVAQIIDARRAKGAFTSFADFCRKVEPSVLTKRVLESLIFAGAFDSLGYTRRGLIENQDKVSGPILAERKAEAAGQFSLFGGDSGVSEIDEEVLEGPEFDRRTLLREEKEMLGQFVTDHPLLGVQDALSAQTSNEIARPRVARRRRPRDDRRHHRRGHSGGSRSAASRTRSSGWRVWPAATR